MTDRTRWLVLAAAGAAGAASVGVFVARRRKTSLPARRDDGYVTERVLTAARSVGFVRELWWDPERLSVVLDRPVTVERLDERRWRCVLHGGDGTDGRTVEVNTEDDGSIRWRVEEGPMAHAGRLRLVPAPSDRGTEIRVEIRYPASRLRHRAAVLRGRDLDQLLRTALRRAKSVLECEQVVSTMNEPSGRGGAAEGLTRIVREKLTTGGRP